MLQLPFAGLFAGFGGLAVGVLAHDLLKVAVGQFPCGFHFELRGRVVDGQLRAGCSGYGFGILERDGSEALCRFVFVGRGASARLAGRGDIADRSEGDQVIDGRCGGHGQPARGADEDALTALTAANGLKGLGAMARQFVPGGAPGLESHIGHRLARFRSCARFAVENGHISGHLGQESDVAADTNDGAFIQSNRFRTLSQDYAARNAVSDVRFFFSESSTSDPSAKSSRGRKSTDAKDSETGNQRYRRTK